RTVHGACRIFATATERRLWCPSLLVMSSNFGAPSRIRTCDLRLRRPTLYPAELWARRRVVILRDASERVSARLYSAVRFVPQRRALDHSAHRGDEHRIVTKLRADPADESDVAAAHFVVARTFAQFFEPRFRIAAEDPNENMTSQKVGDDRRLADRHRNHAVARSARTI